MACSSYFSYSSLSFLMTIFPRTCIKYINFAFSCQTEFLVSSSHFSESLFLKYETRSCFLDTAITGKKESNVVNFHTEMPFSVIFSTWFRLGWKLYYYELKYAICKTYCPMTKLNCWAILWIYLFVHASPERSTRVKSLYGSNALLLSRKSCLR